MVSLISNCTPIGLLVHKLNPRSARSLKTNRKARALLRQRPMQALFQLRVRSTNTSSARMYANSKNHLIPFSPPHHLLPPQHYYSELTTEGAAPLPPSSVPSPLSPLAEAVANRFSCSSCSRSFSANTFALCVCTGNPVQSRLYNILYPMYMQQLHVHVSTIVFENNHVRMGRAVGVRWENSVECRFASYTNNQSSWRKNLKTVSRRVVVRRIIGIQGKE